MVEKFHHGLQKLKYYSNKITSPELGLRTNQKIRKMIFFYKSRYNWGMANQRKQEYNMNILIDKSRKIKVIQPECDICGEGYTVNTVCPYCNFECCKKCFDKYLLTTTGDTKCMSCKQTYDLDTIWKLCNKKTYKEYTEFKHEQLIQKEISLFQETLIEIDQERLEEKARKTALLKGHLRKTIELINSLQLVIIDMRSNDRNITDNMLSQLGLDFDQLVSIKATKDTVKVNAEIDHAITLARKECSNEEKLEELKRNTFIKNCSVPNCKGTLNNRWYCRLCEIPHCNKCGELKRKAGDGEQKNGDDEHICNPDSVQSLEEIKKNSKPCPKCGIAIFKTEGCDQMFCIVCHTAFSWKTLTIETGRIHNPHYYEIMRRDGNTRREEGDIRPCDEDVQFDDRIIRIYQHYNILTPAELGKIQNSFRFVIEIAETYNERREQLTNGTFANLRKKYIKNEISGENFRKQIKMKNTRTIKKIELCRVLGITKIAISEELKRIIREEDGTFIMVSIVSASIPERRNRLRNKYDTFNSNMEEIIKNTNKILETVGAKYTGQSRYIMYSNTGWKITSAV
jgi:hypothetical protein